MVVNSRVSDIRFKVEIVASFGHGEWKCDWMFCTERL